MIQASARLPNAYFYPVPNLSGSLSLILNFGKLIRIFSGESDEIVNFTISIDRCPACGLNPSCTQLAEPQVSLSVKRNRPKNPELGQVGVGFQ